MASSMMLARARGGRACAWVDGFSHGPVLSVRRRAGLKAPPGRTHASAGPLC